MSVKKIFRDYLKDDIKEVRRIHSAIKRYNRIAIFRHIMPDYDALGCQFGLATWLKDNFPEKEIVVLGDNHVTFTPRLYPETDSLSESWFREPFLAIVLDVNSPSRIADPRYKKAKFKIIIDHHPAEGEKHANVQIIKTEAAAAAENILAILLNFKGNYVLSKKAASYFYSAIVGDSGRFQYSSTSKLTFACATECLDAGIEISKIYQQMYLKKIDDLKVTAYILNHFSVSDHGVAYYVLPTNIQEELNITTERGKENVNLFANIEGINAWCSITEDKKDNCWRVSLRSKEKPINQVAMMFEGGGHAQASGAKLNSIDDLPKLIAELDKLF